MYCAIILLINNYYGDLNRVKDRISHEYEFNIDFDSAYLTSG